jgi:hypothetical protein
MRGLEGLPLNRYSREGLGPNPQDDPSAVGAALNMGHLALLSLGGNSGFPTPQHTNQRQRMRAAEGSPVPRKYFFDGLTRRGVRLIR